MVLRRSALTGILLSGLGWQAMAAAAAAQEVGATPAWSQDVYAEVTYDHADDADIAALTLEYGLAVEFAPGWTVQSSAVFEPVEEVAGDSWFEGEGAYLEGVSLNYGDERIGLTVGKFNPVFGAAAALAPGLYGADVGEGYELTERLGLGGEVNLSRVLFPAIGGDHVLSGAWFTADRTVFSQSLGAERPRVRLSDGGVGNTEGLESASVSMDGLYQSGFAYTLGWRRLPAGLPGEADETGVVAGLSHSGLALGEVGFDLLAEAARFTNASGFDGEDRTDYTLAATARRNGWHVSAVVSGAEFGGGAAVGDVSRAELMAGRDLGSGFTLDLGVMAIEDSGDDSTVGGVRLAWTPE
jgi:hypothetical protein